VRRVLFTVDAAPDIIVDAVNRGGVHKVILKNMHAVQIRGQIEAVAVDALRRRLSNGSSKPPSGNLARATEVTR
jgi:hypothetical protein